MRRRWVRCAALAAVAAALGAGSVAEAGDDAASVEARAAFAEGTELVAKAQWAEALAAFERAAKLKPHAVTTYNVGACERAMGRYTRARLSFRKALDDNDAAGGKQLSESLVAETKGFLAEIDGLLSKLSITIAPATAAISVDGRPLALDERASGDVPTYVAGTRSPEPGEPVGKERFVVVVDPGAHVLTFSRKGYADQVVRRTVANGTTATLDLTLDRLPATLHIGSNRDGALVTVGGLDVGPVPVDVLRPAGSYKVVVRKAGFVPYEAQVVVQPGEEVKLRATMAEDKPSVLERWWFWTAAGVVVAGATVGTYFATRTEPTPTRQEISGGTLGWKLKVP